MNIISKEMNGKKEEKKQQNDGKRDKSVYNVYTYYTRNRISKVSR